ncbi:ATP-binding protein [Bacteriovoracaceae bacterium]|nr:ATP-binding protein [Bacteriovoracaceae bacterium]
MFNSFRKGIIGPALALLACLFLSAAVSMIFTYKITSSANYLQANEYPAIGLLRDIRHRLTKNLNLLSSISNLKKGDERLVYEQDELERSMKNLEGLQTRLTSYTPSWSNMASVSLYNEIHKKIEEYEYTVSQIVKKSKLGKVFWKSAVNRELFFKQKKQAEWITVKINSFIVLRNFNVNFEYRSVRKNLIIVTTIQVILLGLGIGSILLLFFYMSRRVFSPLLSIIDFVKKLTNSQFEEELQIRGCRELEILGDRLTNLRNESFRSSKIYKGQISDLETTNWVESKIKRLHELDYRALTFEDFSKSCLNIILAEISGSTAVVYAVEKDRKSLRVIAGHGKNITFVKAWEEVLQKDVGDYNVIQQAVETKETIFLNSLSKEHFKVESGIISGNNGVLVVIPVVKGNDVIAVVELACLNQFSNREKVFLEHLESSLGEIFHRSIMAVNTDDLLGEYLSRNDILDQHTIVTMTNIEGNITFANDLFCETSGYSREELIGSNQNIISSKEHSREFYKNIWKTISSGYCWQGEIKNRRKDGEDFWVKTTIGPVKNDSGDVIGYLGLQNDVTSEKSDRLLITDLGASADELRRSKSTFVANMGHEIRTPINGILGSTSLLRDSSSIEKQIDLLDTIEVCGKGLMELVDDLFEFEKIDSSNLSLNEAPFILEECLSDAIYLVSSQAKQKELEIVKDFEITGKTNVMGDCSRIRKILVNLLSNAVKFTEKGTVTLKTNILPGMNNDFLVRMEVLDTGIGIDKQDYEKIFKSFTQVDDNVTRRYGGTGVGLAISYRLCELMGGELWFSSEVGVGSKFQVSLTLTSAEGIEPKARGKEIETVAEVIEERHNIDIPQIFDILIVEDNLMNQKIIVKYLQRMGQKPDVAENGKQALEMLEKKKYYLIFMDVQMPVMDGITATKKIVKIYGKNAPWIVAFTTNAMDYDQERCLAAGMNDFITKPLVKKDLIRTLSKMRREYGREIVVVKETSLKLVENEEVELKVLNRTLIEEEYYGMYDLYCEMGGHFIVEAPKALAKMKSSLGDSDDFKKYVHQLRTIAAPLHAEILKNLFNTMPDVDENISDWLQDVEKELSNLSSEIEIIVSEFKNKNVA